MLIRAVAPAVKPPSYGQPYGVDSTTGKALVTAASLLGDLADDAVHEPVHALDAGGAIGQRLAVLDLDGAVLVLDRSGEDRCALHLELGQVPGDQGLRVRGDARAER